MLFVYIKKRLFFLSIFKDLRFQFLLIFSIILVLPGCTTLNPATGREEIVVFSTPMEVMMGQDIQLQMQAGEKFSGDKAMNARLDRIGRRVAQVSDRQDYEYHFYLIDKDEMNAFTVPGGSVYVYTGLLRKLKSDAEVAAVLAHEIGHCSARHVAKKFQASLGYDMVSSLVFGNMQNELMLRIAKLGASAIMDIAMSAYSRDDEYQADRLGVKYMYLAGYDPQGMVSTFEVLGESSKGDDGDWMLLRSHPRLKDRIEAVKKEIEVVKGKY